MTPPARSAHRSTGFHSTASCLQGSQCNKLPTFLNAQQSFLKQTQHLRKLLHGFAPRLLDQDGRWSGWGNNGGGWDLAGTLPARMLGGGWDAWSPVPVLPAAPQPPPPGALFLPLWSLHPHPRDTRDQHHRRMITLDKRTIYRGVRQEVGYSWLPHFLPLWSLWTQHYPQLQIPHRLNI